MSRWEGRLEEFVQWVSENRPTPTVVFGSGSGERQVQPSVKSLEHNPELQATGRV